MRSNSENTNSCVHPTRLIEAADAILQADSKAPGRKGVVAMRTDPSAGSSGGGFTSVELIEAYMFLCRLGVLESDERTRV
jgi:hypothetical protein